MVNIFHSRPILLMNPNLSLDEEEELESSILDNLLDNQMINSEDLQSSDELFREFAKGYIDLNLMKSFYNNLFTKLDLYRSEIATERVTLDGNFSRLFDKIREINIILSVLLQFIKIGFPKFEEIRKLVDIMGSFIENFTELIMNANQDSNQTEDRDSIGKSNVQKNFAYIHKFLYQTSKILSSINKYRLHAIIAIIIKFFHSVGLKGNFSKEMTNKFFDSFRSLINIFNFEKQAEVNKQSPTVTVEEYSKINIIYNKMIATGRSGNQETLVGILDLINFGSANLISQKETSICSMMTRILLVIINGRDYSANKKNIQKSLKYFDEVYNIKILRKSVQLMVGDYYMRPVKIIAKLRNLQFIFDDSSLRKMLHLIDFEPDLIKFYLDNIQKKTDLMEIINENQHILQVIKKINKELTIQYLNKIYFKKMQKMIQISKLVDLCIALFNKIHHRFHVRDDSEGSIVAVAAIIEIEPEIKELFADLKLFLILQLKNNNLKMIKNCLYIKNQCINIFIKYGFECDDLVGELNQYLDSQVINEDIKNIFNIIDNNVFFDYFFKASQHQIDKISSNSTVLIDSSAKIEQFLNILRHLTQYPDNKSKREFQALILNNLLQMKLLKTILDKDFLNNFCAETRKNLPQLKISLFSIRKGISSKFKTFF